jgi:transporter family-2 protein
VNKEVALVVALVIGGVVALQGPLNSQLARSVGGLPATTVALGISFVSVLLLAVSLGQIGQLGDIGQAPWYTIVGGGLVGGLFVASIVWTIRALGVTGLSAATLAGQFAAALVIDHFGWLGVEKSPITVSKLAGVALLAAGTYLIVSD